MVLNEAQRSLEGKWSPHRLPQDDRSSSHPWEALAQQPIRLLLTYGANGGKSIVGLKKSEEDREIVVNCEFETEKISNLKCG